MHRIKVLLAILYLVAAPALAFANSEWTDEQGNPGHTGYVPITTNPAKYHQLWETPIGSVDKFKHRSTRDNIITKNRAFYIDSWFSDPTSLNQQIVALDTKTGKTLWKSEPIHSSMSVNYVNGKLIYGRHVLQAETGEPVNNAGYPTGQYIMGVYHSTLYFANDNLISSFDEITGKTLWVSNEPNHGKGKFLGTAISNHAIFSQYEQNLVIRDSMTGRIAFNIDMTGSMMRWIVRSPVLDEKSNVAYVQYVSGVGTTSGYLYAVDLNQRKIRWRLDNQETYSSPVVVGNLVFSFNDESTTINAVNTTSGKIEWTWQSDEDHIGSTDLIATNDVLFVKNNQYTYAISLATHKTVWKINKTGTLSVADNKLFISNHVARADGSSNNYVTAIALS